MRGTLANLRGQFGRYSNAAQLLQLFRTSGPLLALGLASEQARTFGGGIADFATTARDPRQGTGAAFEQLLPKTPFFGGFIEFGRDLRSALGQAANASGIGRHLPEGSALRGAGREVGDEEKLENLKAIEESLSKQAASFDLIRKNAIDTAEAVAKMRREAASFGLQGVPAIQQNIENARAERTEALRSKSREQREGLTSNLEDQLNNLNLRIIREQQLARTGDEDAPARLKELKGRKAQILVQGYIDRAQLTKEQNKELAESDRLAETQRIVQEHEANRQRAEEWRRSLNEIARDQATAAATHLRAAQQTLAAELVTLKASLSERVEAIRAAQREADRQDPAARNQHAAEAAGQIGAARAAAGAQEGAAFAGTQQSAARTLFEQSESENERRGRFGDKLAEERAVRERVRDEFGRERAQLSETIHDLEERLRAGPNPQASQQLNAAKKSLSTLGARQETQEEQEAAKLHSDQQQEERDHQRHIRQIQDEAAVDRLRAIGADFAAEKEQRRRAYAEELREISEKAEREKAAKPFDATNIDRRATEEGAAAKDLFRAQLNDVFRNELEKTSRSAVLPRNTESRFLGGASLVAQPRLQSEMISGALSAARFLAGDATDHSSAAIHREHYGPESAAKRFDHAQRALDNAGYAHADPSRIAELTKQRDIAKRAVGPAAGHAGAPGRGTLHTPGTSSQGPAQDLKLIAQSVAKLIAESAMQTKELQAIKTKIPSLNLKPAGVGGGT